MCYSAQIRAEYRKFEREFGATMDIRQYARFFWERRQDGSWRKITKAMKDAFADPRNEDERNIHDLIVAGDAELARTLETELFAQKKRLADAERALQARTTKKAGNERRIARNKMEAAQRNLADLRRTERLPRDARIFPGQYAPVMIVRDGKRVLVPMRYQCRLPGWSEAAERKYPGTYNARRDSLEKTWARLFGHRHGIMIVTAFYENVARHKVEHRELAPGEKGENVVLEFRPQPPHDMLVACLWNHSPGGDSGLYSFASITDQPPPEIAAAGHDRCIIPIKPENVEAWLAPDPSNLPALHAILDDRDRPYYEHRMAA
ncbi:MAG TPA: SOS response-associated peptidase family protein [Rhodanobacteraceae bacterium]|jgi:putative SOS response-associated peptidase YedK|nr:SOS response-associated peptidase family protein [Rhodanobacteraceae bacterium]